MSLYSNKSGEFDQSKIKLPKLHQAAKSGNVMKLDKELRKFEITQKDTIGRTAIHIAAIHDKVKIKILRLIF